MYKCTQRPDGVYKCKMTVHPDYFLRELYDRLPSSLDGIYKYAPVLRSQGYRAIMLITVPCDLPNPKVNIAAAAHLTNELLEIDPLFWT